jgi:hypothetical protein
MYQINLNFKLVMGVLMERIVPGLVIAGMAAVVGTGIQSEPVSTTDPNVGYDSGIIYRDAPVVYEESVTQTHRGFAPAQDAVCEHVQ